MITTKPNSKKNNNKLGILLITSILIFVLIYPETCMEGCSKGLELFVTALFPTLFPFLVLCNILIHFKGEEFYAPYLGPLICKPLKLPSSCSIVILISFLCGYPMGAKYTCSLYENKQITYDNAQRLLNIASNASPLFILGTVSLSILKNSFYGIILLLSNYLSCILMGLLLNNKNSSHKNNTVLLTNKNALPSFAKAFSMSIDDGISVTIKVGAYVIIFSVLNNLIMKSQVFNSLISSNNIIRVISSFLMSLFELTNGCMLISSINAPVYIKLGLISFAISFSGICIILQVYSIVISHGFSIKKYVIRKLFQGMLSFLITVAIYFTLFQNISSTTMAYCYKADYKAKYFIMIILTLLLLVFNVLFSIKKQNHPKKS
ncbi:sporulation integral membrane protein YlbJ [Hathewaya proteolytica DSM 3090]|uniref:Sporulation integral membrane protein YlbJ n=1 Tax=Hathewaya proteolytica DSM 3090 TaxID=1121331 RepID=A0A1M6J9C7_9CLOT|nr:sporulation integral membrane protein YlbJ [Hathewaya proteolytica]SHJ43271.1 sporulation integral membrane protein YlbJ [Hathewaya proteolytica DSM 3090]